MSAPGEGRPSDPHHGGEHAGRIAVVTGASRGIGRTLALMLGRQGATVVVNYRTNSELAAEVVAELRRSGGEGIAVRADLENPEEIVRLFETVAAEYGRIDYFVNNAAASAFKRVLDLRTHHLDRSYAMNVRPFVLGAQEAVKLMDRGGRIVAVSSYGSMRAFATYALLGSYKATVESFIRYMAVEFAGYGITVNGVNGGLIESDSLDYFYSLPGMAPMPAVIETIPLRRAGTAADMANAIDFLLSERAAYITGQTLVVDGGMTISAAPYYHDTSSPLGLPERPGRE
ncbi:SDR family oxidoreductase [Pseudactinotalea sp. HY158]|uniref:SDR family oxidoreductase n=1 Tax=unclassified Pseudactinotalea TaxID=2649176 RepID=UPI00129CE48C|nr:SDR family oxidoreductase [Pseudactinotalea sp. HY158]MPV48761.1 SDR family oxidoreductase [Pseudactinotalea sp. HY160]QGH68748.1 SDR family oxidoreductase [Pseudactinotalea sp. HY158]